MADNHGLAGIVESLSGDFVCRFLTATRSEIQSQEVKEGGFSLRTKELHHAHVASACEQGKPCCGVKTTCALAESLSFFEVTAGFPPDLAHDLFEGIVPVELAECFGLLLAKKYFTFDTLNELIQSFPYKWGDKTNHPHLLPRAFQSKKKYWWQLTRELMFIKTNTTDCWKTNSRRRTSLAANIRFEGYC